MRVSLFLIFSILLLKSFAQNLPSIIPPSPEIGSIANSYNFSSSMFTGAASVNIPIYNLKVGEIELPISFNYSSNGIKVNDIPSRIGLGWSMIAGGSVSKIIHDEDDDDPMTIRLVDPNFFVESDAIVDYCNQNLMEGYDSEFDEYSFNAGTISGKFFIDAAGTIRSASKTDNKIERLGSNGFKITTGQGIKYCFSTVTEETRDVKTNGVLRTRLKKTTAWFLTRIESPIDDLIVFKYNAINTLAFLGSNQSVILKNKAPVYTANQYNCGACVDGALESPKINLIQYATNYLTEISCSNGLNVYFNYEARPEPETGNDNRLIALNVFSQSKSGFIKKI